MGKILAVCISEQKGTLKTAVDKGLMIKDFGLEHDAHAGKWHRQISLLAVEAVRAFEEKYNFKVPAGAFGENLLVEGIKSIPLLDCNMPEATFYLMVNISGTGMKSEQFAVELLKTVHVAVVPGISYGRTCDDYVRMAFTVGEEKIKEGLKRIRLFTESLL